MINELFACSQSYDYSHLRQSPKVHEVRAAIGPLAAHNPQLFRKTWDFPVELHRYLGEHGFIELGAGGLMNHRRKGGWELERDRLRRRCR